MKPEEVLNFVDVDYVASLTQALIRIPTESPAPDERNDRTPMVNLITEEFKKLGFETKLLTVVEGRPNIMVEIQGDRPGPTLMLYSHTDTIEVTKQHSSLWNTDPFGAEVIDGRIYGVGSADTKGGVAGVMGAIKAIKTSGIKFGGKIVILFSTAAESAQPGGPLSLIQHNLLPKADVAILADSSNMQIVRTFKGRVWFEFSVYGKSAHASDPELGINAVEKMCDVISALKKIRFAESPDADLGDVTLAITSIDGINVGSSIPARCVIKADMRTIPGLSADQATQKIQSTLDDLMQKDKELKVEMAIMPNSIKKSEQTPADSPIVRSVAKAMETVVGKAEYLPGVMSTGAVYFLDAGILPVFFGPGSIFNAHMPNEYVEISRLEEATKIYVLAALDFLGSD